MHVLRPCRDQGTTPVYPSLAPRALSICSFSSAIVSRCSKIVSRVSESSALSSAISSAPVGVAVEVGVGVREQE